MTETIQKFPQHGEGDDDMYQDPPLAERSDCYDAEADIVASTRYLLGNLDRPVSSDCQPSADILAYLADAQRSVSTLPIQPTASEPDIEESFRDDPNSAFRQSRAKLIAFVDACTSEWWRSDTLTPETSVARARTSSLALLFDHLSGYYGFQSDGTAIVGQTADARQMNIVGDVPTGNRNLVGKVADVVHVGFTLNDGERWRFPDVRRYVDELDAVNEDLRRRRVPEGLRII